MDAITYIDDYIVEREYMRLVGEDMPNYINGARETSLDSKKFAQQLRKNISPNEYAASLDDFSDMFITPAINHHISKTFNKYIKNDEKPK